MLNTHRSRIITIFALYIHTECKLNLHEAQINLVKSLLEFLNFHANLCMCHSLTIINHSDLNPAIVNYKVLNNTILPHKNVVRQTDFAPFGSFIIGVIFRLIIQNYLWSKTKYSFCIASMNLIWWLSCNEINAFMSNGTFLCWQIYSSNTYYIFKFQAYKLQGCNKAAS